MPALAFLSDSLAFALRAQALEYAAEIETQLQRASSGRHTGVHRARKSLARLRALLSLLRAAPQLVTGLEQRARALTRGLSKLRDAQAAHGMARRLSRRKLVPDTRAEWRTVIDAIETERDRLLAAAQRTDPGFAKPRGHVAALQAAIDAYDWSTTGPADIETALRHSVRRARRARKEARANSTEAPRHRLRRRTRRVLLQVDILLGIAGDTRHPRAAKQAHRLIEHELHRRQTRKRVVDLLGDERDLQLLRRALRRLPRAEAVDHALRTTDESLPRAIAASNKAIT